MESNEVFLMGGFRSISYMPSKLVINSFRCEPTKLALIRMNLREGNSSRLINFLNHNSILEFIGYDEVVIYSSSRSKYFNDSNSLSLMKVLSSHSMVSSFISANKITNYLSYLVEDELKSTSFTTNSVNLDLNLETVDTKTITQEDHSFLTLLKAEIHQSFINYIKRLES